MRLIVLTALVATFSVLGGAVANAANPGGITGFVRDKNGRPVPFAVVSLIQVGGGERRINADANGFFADLMVDPGRYAIFARGGADQMQGCGFVAIFPDESSRTTIRLEYDRTVMLDPCWRHSGLVDPNQAADVYRI